MKYFHWVSSCYYGYHVPAFILLRKLEFVFFRVAVVPAVVSKLVKKGFSVNIEENAGAAANFPNKIYEEAGAIVTSLKDTFQSGKNFITIMATIFILINIKYSYEISCFRYNT